MTQPVIARIENGRVTPSLGTLERLADALGVDLVVQLNPPSLARLRAEVAEGHESLLHALDRVAVEWLGRASGHPDADRYVRPYIEELLGLHFEGHPWARLLVAWYAHWHSNRRALAETMIEESWQDFRRAHNRTGQGYVAWIRGTIALSKGDLQVARQRWETVRELLPTDSPMEPIDELALAHSALGAYARGDLDECASTARQAVVLAQLRANCPAEGIALVYLTFVALNRGDFSEAADFLDRADAAFEAATKPEDRVPRSLVATCRGTLLVLRGEHGDALKAFTEATNSEDLWFTFIAQAVRAELTAPFDPDGAETAARFVLAWAKTSGDQWWRTWAERGLGIVARVRGQLESSREILTSIVDLNPLEQGRTLIALGETLAQLGDARGASESLGTAVSLFGKQGATYWEVLALVLLARIQPLHASRLLARARAKSNGDHAYGLLLAPAPGRLCIGLGEPRFLLIDGVALRFRSRRAVDLICTLAAEGPMSPMTLAARIWPTCAPETALPRLRTAVWDARRGLGSEAWRLERQGGRLCLELQGAHLDSGRDKPCTEQG
jgi:tetratricopeptide (TPR) repeat protein